MTVTQLERPRIRTGSWLPRVPVAPWRKVSFRALVLGTVALAFFARLAYVLATPHFQLVHDEAQYFSQGLYLFHTGHLRPDGSPTSIFQPVKPDAFWPPAYECFLAILLWVHSAFAFLGFGQVTWIRLAEALLSATSVGALMLIGRRLFGAGVGLAAGVIYALLPVTTYVGTSLFSESLFVPLVLFVAAATIWYQQAPSLKRLLLAGVLIGLASLTHSDGIVLVIPCWVAIWSARRPGPLNWRALRPLAGLICVVLLVLAPWAIRNEVKFHHFVPISLSDGLTLAGTYNSAARSNQNYTALWVSPQANVPADARIIKQTGTNQVAQNTRLAHQGVKYMSEHPGYVATVFYWNTKRLLDLAPSSNAERFFAYSAGANDTPRQLAKTKKQRRLARELAQHDVKTSGHGLSESATWSFWLLALLAICGCFTAAVRRAPKWIWLMPAVLFAADVFLSTEMPRFQTPLDPFFALLAAAAVVTALKRATNLREASGAGRRIPNT